MIDLVLHRGCIREVRRVDEMKFEDSKLDDVAVSQAVCGDTPAIDRRAVQASGILDVIAAVHRFNFGVNPRNAHIIENDIAMAAATESDLVRI